MFWFSPTGRELILFDRDAWKQEEGVSKTEAKRRYIAFLIKVR